MDLVSFDTPGEFKMFEEIMARGERTVRNASQYRLMLTCTIPMARSQSKSGKKTPKP